MPRFPASRRRSLTPVTLIVLCLALTSVSPANARAQGTAPLGGTLWKARYNGQANRADEANAVAVSPDGGTVFVTGGSDGSGAIDDYATVAYDAATGTQLWAARYAGPGNGYDTGIAVDVSPDGARVFCHRLQLRLGH